MSNSAFGIDLGTSNIKIYNRSDDTILVEKKKKIKIIYLLMAILLLKCMKKHLQTFIFRIRFPME